MTVTGLITPRGVVLECDLCDEVVTVTPEEFLDAGAEHQREHRELRGVT